MKYRKKPVVIEAIRWDGSNYVQLYHFCTPPNGVSVVGGPHPGDVITINTLEGVMRAEKGDFIIKGVKGEFYPCKPDIFHATYDRAE